MMAIPEFIIHATSVLDLDPEELRLSKKNIYSESLHHKLGAKLRETCKVHTSCPDHIAHEYISALLLSTGYVRDWASSVKERILALCWISIISNQWLSKMGSSLSYDLSMLRQCPNFYKEAFHSFSKIQKKSLHINSSHRPNPSSTYVLMHGRIKNKIKLLNNLEICQAKLINKISQKAVQLSPDIKIRGTNTSIFCLVKPESCNISKSSKAYKQLTEEFEKLKQLKVQLQKQNEHETQFWKWLEKSVTKDETSACSSTSETVLREAEVTGADSSIRREGNARSPTACVRVTSSPANTTNSNSHTGYESNISVSDVSDAIGRDTYVGVDAGVDAGGGRGASTDASHSTRLSREERSKVKYAQLKSAYLPTARKNTSSDHSTNTRPKGGSGGGIMFDQKANRVDNSIKESVSEIGAECNIPKRGVKDGIKALQDEVQSCMEMNAAVEEAVMQIYCSGHKQAIINPTFIREVCLSAQDMIRADIEQYRVRHESSDGSIEEGDLRRNAGRGKGESDVHAEKGGESSSGFETASENITFNTKIPSHLQSSTLPLNMVEYLNFMCPLQDASIGTSLDTLRHQHAELLGRVRITSQKYSPFDFVEIPSATNSTS